MKKVFPKTVLFLVIVLTFKNVSFAQQTGYFPDVPITHPNYTAIETLRTLGFIEGYPDGYFRPSQKVNRAESAAMIVRAMTISPDPGKYKNCFDDVLKEWFAKYVCYGKSTLWLSGYPGTQKFRPESEVIVVELLRMVIDALKVPKLAATEYLKRKWDVPYGYKNVGRSLMPPQWYEDYLVTAREFGLLDISPLASKMMNRAEVAEIIYRVLLFQDRIEAPEDIQKTTCTTMQMQKPPPIPNILVPDYCSFKNPSTGMQIIINETQLSQVWGEDFPLQIPQKSWALALAYSAERFNINPAYLLALAIKESRLNCEINTNGCFQIMPSAFAEVKSQFPQYFSNLSYDDMQKFETAAVITSLYFQTAKALYENWYSLSSFVRDARDKDAYAFIMNRAFNRGLWDLGIKDALSTRRVECQNAVDFENNCLPRNDAGFEHGISVVNYCREISQNENPYDIMLTRSDISQFMDDVIAKMEGSTLNIETVKTHADSIFTCLADTNDTISFRYDFKTFLKELIKILPVLETPANLIYSAP